MSDTAQTSPDKLPLPFGVLIAERNSAALPLPLKRRLGEAESSGETAPDTDIDYGYNPWRDPMRPAVSSSFGFVLHPVAVRSAARGGFSDGLSVGRGWNDIYMETVDAAACMRAATQGMESLRREQESVYTPSVLYSGKAAANISGMADLRRETRANMSGGASLARWGRRQSGAAADLRQCARREYRPSENTAHEISGGAGRRALVDSCVKSASLPALAVPCEWYEIPAEPEPPQPPDNTYVCGLRPPSDKMPLRFRLRSIAHSAEHIPIPFTCFPELEST